MEKETSNKRIVGAHDTNDETQFESTLRPKSLDEFIGQNNIKDNLHIFIQAAQQRKEPLEHVLLYGPPGLGKTTLAHIIAREMNSNIRVTSGPAIERSGDLAAILTNLNAHDVLFIDEIHRLNKVIEEMLYPAMEEHALDLVIGKGPAARTLRLELPHFTIIGATTKISSISSPLRDRFGNIFHLNFYEDSEIEKIVSRSAHILKIMIDSGSCGILSQRSRKTPRIANRLLRRVRDFVQVKSDGNITKENTLRALEMLGVDDFGLDFIDRKILETIVVKFSGGPVGLNTIAAATGEEQSTIEDVYEPFLIQSGFLNRTSQGRITTPLASKHFDSFRRKLL